MEKFSFTRKELAFLVSALELVRLMDAETRKKGGLTDKRLDVMLFKLMRAFESC